MTTQQVAARAKRKVRLGVVTSNKMAKTIVVRVSRSIRHPKYGRVMKQTNSFKAHDETNSAAVGDLVNIMETRPLSKDKRWRLVQIVRRASTAPPVPGTEVAVGPKPDAAEQTSKPPAGRPPLEPDA